MRHKKVKIKCSAVFFFFFLFSVNQSMYNSNKYVKTLTLPPQLEDQPSSDKTTKISTYIGHHLQFHQHHPPLSIRLFSIQFTTTTATTTATTKMMQNSKTHIWISFYYLCTKKELPIPGHGDEMAGWLMRAAGKEVQRIWILKSMKLNTHTHTHERREMKTWFPDEIWISVDAWPHCSLWIRNVVLRFYSSFFFLLTRHK